MELTDNDIELLNSKKGRRNLLAYKKTNLSRALRYTKYEYELEKLQTELIKLQNWVIDTNQKVVIVFEGRDSAGKGGAIRRITQHINPRRFRIVALPKPTSEEEGQWYFQRYANRLPGPGEIVFFDRSWYNRAVVEPVNGFCSQQEYERFMGQVNEFERMLIESGTHLIKLYFSISKSEQKERFEEIESSPLKKWKMSEVDRNAQRLWDEYTKYKEKMFEKTDTEQAPWFVIKANRKTEARLEATRKILELIPYEREQEPRFSEITQTK